MLNSRTFLWLAVLWLAVSPALAAAHEVEHLDEGAAERAACVLCQSGEREDDPALPSAWPPSAPIFANEPAWAGRDCTASINKDRNQSIRAPPAFG